MIRETIEQFLKLQAYDSRIHTIETHLARIPELLKESRTSFETAQAEKEKAETEYTQIKAEILSYETNAAQQKDMLMNAQKKLSSVQNNKEYEAALKELDTLKKGIMEAENKADSLKARSAELESLIAEKSSEASSKEESYLSEKSEKEGENKSLFDELSKLKTEREAFAGTMKKSVLSKYERIRTARQNLAIVSISGEVCTGCNMKLPPQLAVEVKKENELLQCPYCQRFLYHDKTEHQAEVS